MSCYLASHLSLNSPSSEIQGSDHQLRTSAIITLDQILASPDNFTYILNPISDDRYFGFNVFELNITQTNGTATEIKIEVGQYLNTTDSELQNFTVAKQEWINLTGPGNSNVTNLAVFCINVRGDVPQRTDNYLVVPTKATGNLLTLLNYIDNQLLHNFHYAQLAVWAVTDGPSQIPSGYIYNDTEVDWANALLIAAGITGLEIPYLPAIPGFNFWLIIPCFSFVLLPFFIKRMKKRRYYGRE